MQLTEARDLMTLRKWNLFRRNSTNVHELSLRSSIFAQISHKMKDEQEMRTEEKKRGAFQITAREQYWCCCSDLKRARGQTSSLTYYISMKKTTSLKANVVPWHSLLSLFTFLLWKKNKSVTANPVFMYHIRRISLQISL